MAIIVINPNSTATMTDAMVGAARAVAPDLQIEGWTSHDGPPAIQGRDDGLAASAPLLSLVDKAGSLGADGIVIGCFDDTALVEAAARVDCPVIGIGQAAFHYCALRQLRFSVVTTLSVSVPILRENIESYGLSTHLGQVRASEVPVLDLEHAPENATARILETARAAVAEDDIDAIVLGCAGMVHVTRRLREQLPCAVIDPVEAAIGCMTWLTKPIA